MSGQNAARKIAAAMSHTCRSCGKQTVRVIDSRYRIHDECRYRRWLCGNCGARWTTYETRFKPLTHHERVSIPKVLTNIAQRLIVRET